MTDEKFREIEPLDIDGVWAMCGCRCRLVNITWDGSEIILNQKEARALRDWLNKALPEET